MQNNQLFYNNYIEIVKKLVKNQVKNQVKTQDNNRLNLDYLKEISPETFRRIEEYVALNNLTNVEFRIVNDNYYKFKDFIKFVKIIDVNYQFFPFLKEFNDLFKHFIINNKEQLSIQQTIDTYINKDNIDFIKKLKYLFDIFEIINPFIMKYLNNNNFYLNVMYCTKTLYQMDIVANQNFISLVFDIISYIINNKQQSSNFTNYDTIVTELIKGLNISVDKNIILNLVKSINIDNIENYTF
jgi:hypothetical protein